MPFAAYGLGLLFWLRKALGSSMEGQPLPRTSRLLPKRRLLKPPSEAGGRGVLWEVWEQNWGRERADLSGTSKQQILTPLSPAI